MKNILLDLGEVKRDMQNLAVKIKQKREKLQRESEERDPERSQIPWTFDEDSLKRGEEYFKNKMENPDLDVPDSDDEEEALLVKWDSEDWAYIERLHTKIHSIATLSGSITEATSVLLTNKNLPVRIFFYLLYDNKIKVYIIEWPPPDLYFKRLLIFVTLLYDISIVLMPHTI